MAAHYERVASDGRKFTVYRCPNCRCAIATPCPTRKGDTGEKGYWDSATECLGCGSTNFVCVWPDGKALAKQLGGDVKVATERKPFAYKGQLINP